MIARSIWEKPTTAVVSLRNVWSQDQRMNDAGNSNDEISRMMLATAVVSRVDAGNGIF